MKRTGNLKRLFVIPFVFLCAVLGAQSVLPGYNGFWKEPKKISVIDLLPYYPDGLSILRNEIYARYGRPFATAAFRDHFRSQNWYREQGNFSESWLSANDKENAELILSVERSTQSIEAVTRQVLQTIEYSNADAVLTFTSRQELVWTDPHVDFGLYSLNGSSAQTMTWLVMGNWILIVDLDYRYSGSPYNVAAYKLDFETGKISGRAVTGNVPLNDFERLYRAQGRSVPK